MAHVHQTNKNSNLWGVKHTEVEVESLDSCDWKAAFTPPPEKNHSIILPTKTYTIYNKKENTPKKITNHTHLKIEARKKKTYGAWSTWPSCTVKGKMGPTKNRHKALVRATSCNEGCRFTSAEAPQACLEKAKRSYKQVWNHIWKVQWWRWQYLFL